MKLKRRDQRILFANSDLSGISIFEEANFMAWKLPNIFVDAF